jgi:hypothetical protein
MFGARVLREFNPRLSPLFPKNNNAFFAIPNTLPLPNGL